MQHSYKFEQTWGKGLMLWPVRPLWNNMQDETKHKTPAKMHAELASYTRIALRPRGTNILCFMFNNPMDLTCS